MTDKLTHIQPHTRTLPDGRTVKVPGYMKGTGMTPLPRKTARGIPRVYTFVVTGDDQFPLDMLRYDICHPKREIDSNEIERSFRPRERGPHHVTLAGPKAPTEARWGSFGWALESVE